MVEASTLDINDSETGVAQDILQGPTVEGVSADEASEPVLLMEDVYEAI